MARNTFRRWPLLTAVVVVWLLATIALLARSGLAKTPVTINHWANGHMMSETLLPAFAKQFNQAGHRTRSGNPIEVKTFVANSGTITDELVSRASRGAAIDRKLPDPTLVTPAADHWLSLANYATGRTLVDLTRMPKLATTYIGVATYRDIAECLGWPNREISIAEIVALRTDSRGWGQCRNAKIEWGSKPLMSFTDPDSSSTARSMLFSLYAMGAGKSVEQLTPEDVGNPAVVDYIRRFQNAVDHYVPDTLILNSKIYGGPRYGHFFFISEENLVQLYQGKVAVTVGSETKPQPLARDMVMIYPKEGSAIHNQSAGLVEASWVTPEQVEAAQLWVDFLRETPRQQAFMQEGFRPGTDIPLMEVIGSRNGLDPNKPTVRLNPDRIPPPAAEAIVSTWGDVKKPGIVTFAVDVSGSMQGTKLEQAKQGLRKAIDNMNPRNSAGLLTFADRVFSRVPAGPLSGNRVALGDAIDQMKAQGGTGLYDALKEAIDMADRAPGDEAAIRGVVVITDGRANGGSTWLGDLVTLISTSEKPIQRFRGFEEDSQAHEDGGRTVAKTEVMGTGLARETRHEIHVFFVGIGKDADMEIGRMLAEATGSAFRGATEKDLAGVIETFGKYF